MKDLLVQLDGGDSSARRFAVALALAQRCGARLTGLFAEVETEAAALVARRPGRRFAAAEAASHQAFDAELAHSGLAGGWLALAHGEPGFVTAETAFCARFFDLAVVGRGGGRYAALPDDLVERVVAESGRPILVIPEGGAVASVGERVVVAWNASRAASRALHDSLPVLARAAEVTLLSVPPPQPAPFGDLPQLDVVAHLAAHGISARLESMPADDIGVMDLLLSRAYDLAADLMIVGAGPGFGPGTRFLLQHLTVPVIISD